MKKNKGFTLIEILITITIIGVLSSITIFSYKNYVSVSNEASTKQELVQLAQVLEIGVIEGNFEHQSSTINYADLQDAYESITETELPFSETEVSYNNNVLTLTRRGVTLTYDFETRTVS